MSDMVFVYGSLKAGFQHADEMQGAELVGADSLKGAHLVLYEEDYPGLVLAPAEANVVEGEVYRVSEELLGKLDAFEECPELYQRTAVELESGRTAWVYSVSASQAAPYRRIAGVWRGRAAC